MLSEKVEFLAHGTPVEYFSLSLQRWIPAVNILPKQNKSRVGPRAVSLLGKVGDFRRNNIFAQKPSRGVIFRVCPYTSRLQPASARRLLTTEGVLLLELPIPLPFMYATGGALRLFSNTQFVLPCHACSRQKFKNNLFTKDKWLKLKSAKNQKASGVGREN